MPRQLPDDHAALVEARPTVSAVSPAQPERDERALARLAGDVVAALEQQLAAAVGQRRGRARSGPSGRSVSAASSPASEAAGVNVVSNRRAPAFGSHVPSAMS